MKVWVCETPSFELMGYESGNHHPSMKMITSLFELIIEVGKSNSRVF